MRVLFPILYGEVVGALGDMVEQFWDVLPFDGLSYLPDMRSPNQHVTILVVTGILRGVDYNG